MKLYQQLLAVLLLTSVMQVLPVMAVQSDTAREKVIADKLTDTLSQGEIVWLNPDSPRKYLGIYTETFHGYHETGILLVHGIGAHPDWPEVIAPLRRSLPTYGWPTLSIQMPVLPPESPVAKYGATLHQATARINIAAGYLVNKGFHHIIIIGYGFGAATVSHYLANNRNKNVIAFVSISMTARKYLNPNIDFLGDLRQIQIPVLDIYGSNDLPAVIKTIDDRRLAGLNNDNPVYRQVELPDADHYYTGRAEDLLRQISSWIEEITGQTMTGKPPDE